VPHELQPRASVRPSPSPPRRVSTAGSLLTERVQPTLAVGLEMGNLAVGQHGLSKTGSSQSSLMLRQLRGNVALLGQFRSRECLLNSPAAKPILGDGPPTTLRQPQPPPQPLVTRTALVLGMLPAYLELADQPSLRPLELFRPFKDRLLRGTAALCEQRPAVS